MAVNHELLDNVLWYIKEHPEEWDQGQWVTPMSCGTAYCFAGHAAIMDGWFILLNRDSTAAFKPGHAPSGVCDAAIESLGLDLYSALYLFNGGNSLRALEKMVAVIHEKDKISDYDFKEIRDANAIAAVEDAS